MNGISMYNNREVYQIFRKIGMPGVSAQSLVQLEGTYVSYDAARANVAELRAMIGEFARPIYYDIVAVEPPSFASPDGRLCDSYRNDREMKVRKVVEVVAE